ncbi:MULTISPECIES: CGA synthase-related protein [Streptomyces]|uniref:CGA synthase-related protein n=1 Tax=Streptomyces TaxID=1883 RepID=UPI00345C00CF
MAVLTPGGASSPPPESRRPGTRQRVLLVSREEELDSLLALRRVAAHLGELAVTTDRSAEPPPVAALVCDDEGATVWLMARGVPVVHLFSGGRGPEGTGVAGVAGPALRWLHRPDWLPATEPLGPGIRAAGTLAPVRTAKDRNRTGALLLLSLWGVPDDEVRAFTDGPLRALVRAAADQAGNCDVVCDTGLAAVRSSLAAVGAPEAVRLHRAADVDVDALHAGSEVFLASPTPAAVGLARARHAPLCFLPPLGEAQGALAECVRRVVPVPVAEGHSGKPLPYVPPADALWQAVDTSGDDLRGAQRIARSLRQLSLAPL